MKKAFIALMLGFCFVLALFWLLTGNAQARSVQPVMQQNAVPLFQMGTGVVRVALTGADGPSCGDVATPCATVQFAVDQALPGETVVVFAGTFNESVTLSKAVNLTGVSSATTIIQALPGQRVLTVTGAAINNSVVISGLTFTGGDVSAGNVCATITTTNCGGGVLLTDNARPFIQNVIIENNNAYRGGGLYANETGGLVLDRVIFRNNSSVLSGGGLNARNMPVTVTNSLFQQNTTTDNVGGAFLTGANFGIVAPVLISNTTFLNNTAQCGGSICDAPAAYLFDQDTQIINSYFEGNSCTIANCDGGGVFMLSSFNSPTLSLINTDFINNTAGGSGGGVLVGNIGQMQVAGGRFENNRALSGDGGGLDHSNFLFAAVATINGTQFISNSAALDGGGLYSVNDITVNNVTFERNSSSEDGGGLSIDFAGAGSSLNNTNFFSNTAQSEGGGVLVRSSNFTVTGGVFSGNSAVVDGGGLWVNNGLLLNGTQFISNTAEENGGGAYVNSGGVVLNGGLFERNVSRGTNTFAGGGGGLYAINAVSNLTINGTDFIANRAALRGGGVWAFGTTILNGGSFQNNVAVANSGGGIQTSGSLIADGAQFTGNVSGFSGGGAQAAGPVDIRNVLFQNNQASTGGGLAASDVATVDNVQFLSNVAITNTGGGLASFDALTVTNSLFQGNSSAGNGGGLSGSFDPVVSNNTTFINNIAGANGGGLSTNGNIILTDVLVQANSAITNGGGLHTSGTVFFTNSQIVSNTAGGNGGGIWANSRLDSTNGRIENNTSGGSGGGYYGGLAQLFVNGTVFANNQAGADGGGAYAFDGRDVDNALFEGNTATGAGGGLFLQRFVEVNATRFLGNSANLGGGLAVLRTNTGTFIQSVDNSLFARNTAATSGNGIYWNQPRPVDLIHNTFANPTVAAGAAIHIVTGTVNITNNIVASYTVGINVAGGTVAENYNLFAGNTTNISGIVNSGGNSFTGNPAFIDPPGDDYRISDTSDAVNTGTNAGVFADFFGQIRPGAGSFDIGYYETTSVLNLAVGGLTSFIVDDGITVSTTWLVRWLGVLLILPAVVVLLMWRFRAKQN